MIKIIPELKSLSELGKYFDLDLPEGKIEYLTYKDRKLTVYTDKIYILNELEDRITKYLKIHTVFKPVHLKSMEENIKEIVDATLYSNPILHSTLQRCKITLKDTNLIIEVPDQFTRTYIQDHEVIPYLKRIINDLSEDEFNIKLVDNFQEIPVTEEPKPVYHSAPKKEVINKPKKISKKSLIKISELELDKRATISGEVFSIEVNETKNKTLIYTIYVYDKSSSAIAKIFSKEKLSLKIGDFVILKGTYKFDTYAKENIFMVNSFSLDEEQREFRSDNADKKRVELHLHTKMSALDAVLDLKELFKTISKWGFKAIAVTDHGTLQAYPEFYSLAKKYNIKPIFGVEGYMIESPGDIIKNKKENLKVDEAEYTVFDIETTGLSYEKDEIIEIGAVRIKDGKVTDTFDVFVKAKSKISDFTTKLTSITQEMVDSGLELGEALKKFDNFAKDSVLVAHNAEFDCSFMKINFAKVGMKFDYTYADTLPLAKALIKIKKYKLDYIVNYFNLGNFHHHRAVDDATVTGKVFLELLKLAKKQGIEDFEGLNSLKNSIDFDQIKGRQHINILVKNKTGLKNLYKITSEANLKYFLKKPRIPRFLLQNHREGLIYGTACVQGELFQALLRGASDTELKEIMTFYDFVELQPIDNNEFLIREKGYSRQDLIEMNQRIYKLAKEMGKLVVMTSDAHYLNPEDKILREVLQAGQGFRNFQDSGKFYLKTTDEMLELAKEFLDEDQAYEVVVENTNKIADMIEEFEIVEGKLHPPKIENAEDIVREMTMKKAHELYGEDLPKLIKDRLEMELSSIIDNGYAVLYLIAQKLVKKSNDDGYVVGSRGSVGSSLVATMMGITEVNPLPPHYYCENCNYTEFVDATEYGSGFDLPDKICPKCGEKLKKDGQNIPFSVFMGFQGDKVPDIDLNFSGDYQPRAHKYVEELFGEKNVYRAGTISSIATKTAFGFVRGYEEKTGEKFSKPEATRLAMGITGVKRTTGQHPGGLVIIPSDRDVHEFTPVQRPADDRNSDIRTTHFDYNSLHDDLIKLDVLGHDDPTTIRMLYDLTGFDPREVPMDDKDTMAIFSSTKSLKVDLSDIRTTVGTLGIPEFGTKFVRDMLVDTRPKTFAELVRISGLSHGTNVWLGNAQEIIKKGIVTLKDVISVRDDILLYLLNKGMDRKTAFSIMETVRKGKKLSPEMIQAMKDKNVSDWFIDSCKKISYLFPKAHAVAYVTMAFRIAYFKVHMPLAFYSSYFSIRGDEFDYTIVDRSSDKIRSEILSLYSTPKLDVKQKNRLSTLESAYEMIKRGFKFLPINIEKSDAKNFIIEGDGLRVPFIAVPGLGYKVALSIVEERNKSPFKSIKDFITRTKVNKTITGKMEEIGVLDLPKEDQLSLFK
jgi:DNA polymerase-3 subunit alpha (Gram-positive type)